MDVSSVETACYRLPLERTLSDSTHGRITHFQLVTVRLRDRDGTGGLGYTYTVGAGGTAVRTLIDEEFAPWLKGHDADDIEQLWQRMWRQVHYVGRGGIASFAISAVDIALWDLRSRKRDLPLWRLLGGTDNRVAAYAGGIDLGFSTDQLLAQAGLFLDQGLRAIKMKVGSKCLETDLTRVAAMRELLGPDTPLMVDANMAWSVAQAIDAARALQRYNVYWLEEPTEPDDFAGQARVAREGGLPIAAGENLHTLREFELLISSAAAAFPEPDVANVGGVTAWLKVAALAEQAALPVTSHGVHDLHVHLLAAVPNASYLEVHGFGLDHFLRRPLEICDGYAVAPESPGHGVELDFDRLDTYREPG